MALLRIREVCACKAGSRQVNPAMTALHLRRIDPSRNMRRFYRLDMQPDLFGGCCS